MRIVRFASRNENVQVRKPEWAAFRQSWRARRCEAGYRPKKAGELQLQNHNLATQANTIRARKNRWRTIQARKEIRNKVVCPLGGCSMRRFSAHILLKPLVFGS